MYAIGSSNSPAAAAAASSPVFQGGASASSAAADAQTQGGAPTPSAAADAQASLLRIMGGKLTAQIFLKEEKADAEEKADVDANFSDNAIDVEGQPISFSKAERLVAVFSVARGDTKQKMLCVIERGKDGGVQEELKKITVKFQDVSWYLV